MMHRTGSRCAISHSLTSSNAAGVVLRPPASVRNHRNSNSGVVVASLGSMEASSSTKSGGVARGGELPLREIPGMCET